MVLAISHTDAAINNQITITGSKSETNRLLILDALFKNLDVYNISNSDDAQVMQKALSSTIENVDIHHAGTAMRFLTAYFSIQEGRKTLLTGSSRMQERPIAILVDALRSLGAEITYATNEGYPPIHILGKKLTHRDVTLQANVSSQYISALMLIGGALPQGLKISLEGKTTSVPYIKMTLALLNEAGIDGTFEGNTITISPSTQVATKTITVESDWSSASYFYSAVALSQEATVSIRSYKENSLQGDAVLQAIYQKFGVQSTFEGDILTLRKQADFKQEGYIELDLSNCPDIAQTIAVTCLGLGVSCKLTGLHTLKIKETDRLEALQVEITKLGGNITVTNDTLKLESQKRPLNQNVSIATYHDHRMAMAFAPLAQKVDLQIEDAGVVSKSYPDFWQDFKEMGFTQKIIG